MKKIGDWYWPDHERHLIDWMAAPKNKTVILNGRIAYQGRKQILALDQIPGDRRRTMIDVGAHSGTWSYNFAHWFDHVEAFEPVIAHRECFEANTAPVKGKITLNPFALGDRGAMVSIVTETGSSGNSMVSVSGKGTVEMRTLDSFEFQDVDFIKIDVEGYEEFVLRGAERTIKKWKPVICVEQKRDMSMRFGLKQLGALKWLYTLGIGYETVAESSGDFILKVKA